jgi:hypothetical protein
MGEMREKKPLAKSIFNLTSFSSFDIFGYVRFVMAGVLFTNSGLPHAISFVLRKYGHA